MIHTIIRPNLTTKMSIKDSTGPDLWQISWRGSRYPLPLWQTNNILWLFYKHCQLSCVISTNQIFQIRSHSRIKISVNKWIDNMVEYIHPHKKCIKSDSVIWTGGVIMMQHCMSQSSHCGGNDINKHYNKKHNVEIMFWSSISFIFVLRFFPLDLVRLWWSRAWCYSEM